ncbi:hypothetical protein DDE18_20795 [Nocardioides gansuensis]|uniref:SteA-like C-terminal domain-containing protein n=1 Tax=Nocardioides gansuensis TaxID=2138300 RepID=A0A2T8F551_9ACTN|nr:putative cytokinetic ring protein SteA [Nocardioides gansuensis]PVG80832.1 hypothetical protein DDE18_20795 [Nocardioides gansuensis]
MRIPTRQRTAPDLPGVLGPARSAHRTALLLARVGPGDVAVLDHHDLDRATAQALVDAGVVAVLNAVPMISGRYPALGPEVLVQAGVPVVDSLGQVALARLPDGAQVRVHEGTVLVGDEVVGDGREVDLPLVRAEMERARSSMRAQLESFTHNSAEFLRREEDVLLHGRGIPRPSTTLAGRPVVVVVRSHDWRSELAGIAPFIREQHPVLIGVDGGADALREAGHRPDVVVLGTVDPDELPTREALRKAADVVVLLERGAARSLTEPLVRLGIKPVVFETGATSEDAALLLADAAGAALIVGVGMPATLDEFLDRRRAGLASTYLTRLKVGQRLVDAAAVPRLYDGSVRPRHLAALAVTGLVALGAAVGVTPVGQEWGDALATTATQLLDTLQGNFQ